jgi:hypothetical protein
MSELWYKNPSILFKNYNQFFPKNTMNKNEKINAIARLAVYYAVLIIGLKMDSKWLAVSVVLLVLTLFLGQSDNFDTTNENNCVKPTKENPFMNFTVGDLLENPNRPKACPVSKVRDEQLKLFRSNNIFPDDTDLWGNYINDRNFYTLPSTEIVNDQTGFANFLFGDFGRCKSEGVDCLKHIDNRFSRGRYYYQY